MTTPTSKMGQTWSELFRGDPFGLHVDRPNRIPAGEIEWTEQAEYGDGSAVRMGKVPSPHMYVILYKYTSSHTDQVVYYGSFADTWAHFRRSVQWMDKAEEYKGRVRYFTKGAWHDVPSA